MNELEGTMLLFAPVINVAPHDTVDVKWRPANGKYHHQHNCGSKITTKKLNDITVLRENFLKLLDICYCKLREEELFITWVVLHHSPP